MPGLSVERFLVGKLSDFKASVSQDTGDHIMRKFVRNKATKAFLMADGKWTLDVRLARCFANMFLAHACVHEIHLEDAEIYYAFDRNKTSDYDFAIALT